MAKGKKPRIGKRTSRCLHGIVLLLPRNVADARIEALEEAAGHLDLTWTDVDEEKIQGMEVSHFLRACAQEIFDLSRQENVPS